MTGNRKHAGTEVLILGGAGFIGSNIAGTFHGQGFRIRVVDGLLPNTGGDIRNLQDLRGNIDLIEKKVENMTNLGQLVAESDFIIDCMGLTAHHYGMQHPLEDVRLNITSHLHLIDALKNSKDKKVVFLGSRGQYGRVAENDITEDTPQYGIDSQGICKIAAENYFRIYAQKYGYKVLSLRLTNCFGENQKVTGPDIGLVGSFIRDILSGKTVEIYGSTERTKALVYVKDLTRIVSALYQTDFTPFKAYNIAGEDISLNILLDTIVSVAGKGKYVVKEFPNDVKKMDVGSTRFSQDRLGKALSGTMPQTAIDIAIENTLNYFEQKMREDVDAISL